ncbi:MAG TPA: dihydropteroate synthase, partial [Abditibacteriaceae bacterium]|nr:dihydropteroate synthase [Abditibacteriaceae bacterium]
PGSPSDFTMRIWQCGRHGLPLGSKTYIMGILNVTPDSFSGDGRLGEAAVQSALQMIEDGADILDIGGESTRPGAEPVPAQEELSRVLPVLETLAAQVRVPLSVDTTKATVARAALAAGASIINDISAGTFDQDMLAMLAPVNCGVILMHLRGTPQTMGWSRRAGRAGTRDVILEIMGYWTRRLTAAQVAGIAADRIALDAGFGFGKSVEENLEILRRGSELAACGFPILSGTSRKSTIGRILGDVPLEERIWGTAATTALAIAGGCDVVRVHDVRAMAQVARVADAVVRRTNPGAAVS